MTFIKDILVNTNVVSLLFGSYFTLFVCKFLIFNHAKVQGVKDKLINKIPDLLVIPPPVSGGLLFNVY